MTNQSVPESAPQTLSKASLSPRKIGVVSLGCPKALVDSERIITQLRAEGYELTPDYQDAAAVIVNTCGFIESAVDESLSSIGEAMEQNGKVIVTGCLGARKTVITDKFPNVLHVSGPQAYESVMDAVRTHAPIEHHDFTSLIPPGGLKLTPRHYAYLKISEGCNHSCTFCIIPSMRGKLQSRPIHHVMIEAEKLVQAGVKELLVISQDTSAYGVDTKYKTETWKDKTFRTKFYDLAEAMSELGVWVRLHYVYPYPHVDEVIPLMAEGKILPYLDIPFQHASPSVLKAMKRPAHAENVLTRIKAWREICPELTIRSTFIVGFPGETEDDFQQLLDFLEEAQLDRVGCFQYSPVEGAKANELADPVPDAIKQDRYERFMALQQQISLERMQQKIGTVQTVLIDAFGEDEETGKPVVIARSKADAPEIDGQVYIEVTKKQLATLKVGEFIEVKIVDATEYDLIAKCLAK